MGTYFNVTLQHISFFTCMRRGELVDIFEDLDVDVEEDLEESCVLKLFEVEEFVVGAVVLVAGRFEDLRVRILALV